MTMPVSRRSAAIGGGWSWSMCTLMDSHGTCASPCTQVPRPVGGGPSRLWGARRPKLRDRRRRSPLLETSSSETIEMQSTKPSTSSVLRVDAAPGARHRGRDTFQRFRRVLLFVATMIDVLPRRGRVAVWHLISGWHSIPAIALRYCVLKSLARACGDNVLVGEHVEIRGWEQLSIGSNVSIHRGCYIDATGGVTIGDDVSVAHSTSILSFEHTWHDPSRPIRDNPLSFAPVTVERDVWIGCGCRVLASVTIGTRSVIAAGAVVTKDIPAGSVAGGVPARVLKRISPANIEVRSA
jgi:acetyltransferase-like isoleucine patch superfamily enzyme